MSVRVSPVSSALAPGGPPPEFVIESDRDFVELQVTTEPILFSATTADRRQASNFFASGPIAARNGGIQIMVEEDAWPALSRFPALYYRALAAEDEDAVPDETTVDDQDYEDAPSIQVASLPLPELSAETRRLQWLSADGNRLADEDGRTVVLRGINRPGLERSEPGERGPLGEPTWTSVGAAGIYPAEVEEIVGDWGANLIRLPINQEASLRRPEYLLGIDRLVLWATRLGAYTMLALRRFDSERRFGTKDGLPTYSPPLPEENTLRLWRQLATRYRDQPAVLYDLFSEPHAALPDDEDFALERPQDEYSWLELWHRWIRRIEAAIHRINPRALLFVSGWNHGRSLRSFPVLRGERPLPNTAYSAHLFPIDDDASPEDLGSLIDSQGLADNHPIFIGEWGVEGGQLAWGERLETLLREAHTYRAGAWGGLAGWAAWSWTDPLLVEPSDQAGGPRTPTFFGELVRDALAEPAVPSEVPVP